ncbi:hypothetical protein ACO1O0_006941 [Amphichorda felina]
MAFPSPHCESNSEPIDEADGKRDYDDPKGKAPVKRVRFSTLPSRRHAPEPPGLYAQMMFRMDLHGKGRPTQLHITEDPQLGGKALNFGRLKRKALNFEALKQRALNLKVLKQKARKQRAPKQTSSLYNRPLGSLVSKSDTESAPCSQLR